MQPLDIVFWSCLMLGGAYTLISLLLGSFSHGHGHGEIGHDVHLGHHGHLHLGHGGEHGHTPAQGSTQGQSGHASGHHHDHHLHLDEPDLLSKLASVLNPMSLSGFLLGFGGGGVLTGLMGATSTARLVWGTAMGSGMWLVAFWIINIVFGKAGGTSHTRQTGVVGMKAQVTTQITGSSAGMVSYTAAGSRQQIRAITEVGETIPSGETVRIRKIENNTAFVTRLEDREKLYVGLNKP